MIIETLMRKLEAAFLVFCLAMSPPVIAWADVPPTAQQTKPTPSPERPLMPEGLYLLDGDQGVMPFLLVENGQWKDPFEWTQNHGIEALNAHFLRGKTLQSFHVYTKHQELKDVALNSLSLKELLAHDELIRFAKVDAGPLLPMISSLQCSYKAAEKVWSCASPPITRTLVNMRCGSEHIGCGVSLITSPQAYRQLTAWTLDQGKLKVNSDAIGIQIAEEFKATNLSVLKNLLKLNTLLDDAFYGSKGQGLISGKFQLNYKSKDMRHHPKNWVEEPSSSVELGFVWDIARARFAYLQTAPEILDAALMDACTHRGKRLACPEVSPLAMWGVGSKLYVVWRYSQRLGVRAERHPPSFGVYQLEPRDGASIPQVGRLAILEMAPDKKQSSEIFTTDHFFFLIPF